MNHPEPHLILKWLIFLTAMTILLIATQAKAADVWSKADVNREMAVIALNVADFGTTVVFRSQNKGIHEANPIFGRDVSDAELFAVTVATSALHIWITDIIPAKYRPAWQYSFGGIKLLVVGHNLGVGFNIQF